MSNIKIKKMKLKKSDLINIVLNNFHFALSNDIMTYDYDFFEIKEDQYLVGYIIKYSLPKTINTEYIDIYIVSNFRNKRIGSNALQYYINNIAKKDIIAIKATKKNKIRFLESNGFIHDKVYIYKNLYKYKRNDKNE